MKSEESLDFYYMKAMTKFIKIYGERNTNTNYVSRLIELNLNVEEIVGSYPPVLRPIRRLIRKREHWLDIYIELTYSKSLGWKHTCVKPPEELKRYKLFMSPNLFFITLTKNPYSWLLSLYRKPYHQNSQAISKLSFEDFLRRPWRTSLRDNVNSSLKNPIELWNVKNRSYIQLYDSNTLRLTSERVIENPEGVIEEISQKFMIEKKVFSFVNYESSTKSENKNTKYYRDYYLSEKWRNDMTSEAISIINESIDVNLMEFYGYRLLSI